MDGEERFDFELLDAEDPFEVDRQIAHLFKHAALGLEDAYEVWTTARASTQPCMHRRIGCLPARCLATRC